MTTRQLSAFSLALLLTACAPHAAPRTARETPDLQVPHIGERALLLLLVDRQTYDDFTVQQCLKGDAALRQDLAVALGRIPDRAGRPILEGLLIDESPAVRRAATFGLGVLGDPQAQSALLLAERDADRETGTLAVEALGKLGARVVDALEPLLPLPEEERWARLLPGLFRFKEETIVSLGERGLAQTQNDPVLHAQAAYALSRNPFPQTLPTLRKLLADGDPRLRAWAARALGIVGTEEDLTALRPLLEDADPGPLIQALRSARALVAAGKVKPLEDWTPRLRTLMDDPRPGVRASAFEAAGVWARPPLGEALAARVDGGEPWEKGTALVALASGKYPQAAARVAASAASEDATLRARSAEAAGLLGLPAEAQVLTPLLADKAPRVRAAAVSAWLTADAKAGGVARKALLDPDPGVRGAALDWLADHPVATFDELQAALPGVYREGLEEMGLAELRALTARGKAEPLERGAVIALLEKAAAAGPYVLRREAGENLAKLGQTKIQAPGPATRQEVDAYRQIVQRTRRPRTVEIHTQRGTITVRLACPEAPLTCLNFLQLTAQGYFNGLTFHRVVPDFVIQGGDPRGDGSGGPGYAIRDEINRLRYGRGAVGMALAGPDTGGSQFFIALSPQPHLDGGYTVFGQVVAGDAVLDEIRLGDRIEKVVEVP
ncbi:MAG TPA: peptidylprolyl isomerase [Thermoanaerobaculia bacterium]|jgi:cyclophilin family peptidyl-prolyl cis-trans isomerase|nr:peptidylprolyl isomerase [Thermoanaerobaculia bacterium]